MAERIQLKEPGSARVMFVAGVTPEQVERNDYYLFHNATAMGGAWEMLVPQSSVKAQLERLGIQSVEQMIGKSVRFGRSTKMSRANKPFWDIDWASGNGSGAERSAGGEMGKPTAGTTSAASPAEPASAKPKMRDAYKSLTEWVLDEIVPIYRQHAYDVPPETVAACVQTLYIQACQSGKVE